MNKALILIVCYNGRKYLEDCLGSLTKINYSQGDHEVLVVDNNSTDDSVEFIKNNYPQVKLIESKENLGFAGGNNLGMRYGLDNNFDYIYLLNQDTEVDPDFLVKAVELAKTDEKIGAVQSKLMLFDDKTKINSSGNMLHYLGFGFTGDYKLSDMRLIPKNIAYASGAGVLLKAKALEEVGFFNKEFFMYHEDTDLSWRMWLMNYRVMIAPDSVVYHKYEFSRSMQKYYYMERNRYILIFQNYKLATIILILPAIMAMDLAMFFYSFVSGWSKEEWKVFKYFSSFESWKKLLVTRRDIQQNRKAPDKKVIKRFVGEIKFQDIDNPLLKYVANPVFNLYWQIVKRIIFW